MEVTLVSARILKSWRKAERVGIVKSALEEKAGSFTKFVSAEKALTAIDFLLRNVIPDDKVPTLLKRC